MFRSPCWIYIAFHMQMRQNVLKMAEMDFKTASSTMEALARISVSISLFPLTLVWLDWHGSSVFPHHYAIQPVFLKMETTWLHVPSPSGVGSGSAFYLHEDWRALGNKLTQRLHCWSNIQYQQQRMGIEVQIGLLVCLIRPGEVWVTDLLKYTSVSNVTNEKHSGKK